MGVCLLELQVVALTRLVKGGYGGLRSWRERKKKEERTLSLGSERVLKETWREKVGLMKMWMYVFDWVHGEGEIFLLLLRLRGQNGLLRWSIETNPSTCLTKNKLIFCIMLLMMSYLLYV